MIFLLQYWKGLAIGALCLGLAGSVAAWRHSLVERGKWQERARVADSTIAANKGILARLDTVVVERAHTVTRTIARVDSLRDTLLQHLTDTVLVKEFVERTDTASRSCLALRSSCLAYRDTAQQQFAAYEVKIHALEGGAIVRRRWYDGRLSIGPSLNVGIDGKVSVGGSLQISVLRWP